MLCSVVAIYGPLFRAMCRYPVLWAVIAIYEPSSIFYRPLSRPMCLHLVLWTLVLIYGSSPYFYVPLTFLLLYVPFSDSMDRYSGLCAVIPGYVPLFQSMSLHLILWAVT